MPTGREPAAMGALLSFAANHGENFPFKIYLCVGKFDFTKEYLNEPSPQQAAGYHAVRMMLISSKQASGNCPQRD